MFVRGHGFVLEDFKTRGFRGAWPGVIACVDVGSFFERILIDAGHFFALEEILGYAILILAPDVGVNVFNF